ncbi:Putative competence protein [Lactobacillus helveticus H10]|nr:Putative competence protein [Lactobacillus helveticus H10]AHI11644.1 Putative competence protein [Lactobacillus helveticus H9]
MFYLDWLMCNWHVFEVINANVFNDARTLRRKKMKKKMKRYLLNILAKNRRQEGFTLIEMVVVIAIIVILMVLIVPNMLNQKEKAENKTSDAFKTTLQTQVEMYKDDDHGTPTKFDELLKGDYLTQDQVNKANKSFKLENGKVTEINKK